MYGGPSPLCLKPIPSLQNPVLTAKDITEVDARFLADPFMLCDGGRWHMFFEVMPRKTKVGMIGSAASSDGLHWSFTGIVLRDREHLSYPFVFEFEREIYMVPETSAAREIRLYRATQFPEKWEFDKVLIRGDYLDPTIFAHHGDWYMLTTEVEAGAWRLKLFTSNRPTGPWKEHPKSPVRESPWRLCRMAGRPIYDEGRLIIFCQDARGRYGTAALAFEVKKLSPGEYEEALLQERVIEASGTGWNSHGMHNLDAHEISPGNWLACVDGLIGNRALVQFK